MQLKRIISGILATGMLTLALAGCGSSSSSSSTTASDSSSSSSDKVFKIGYANSADSDVFDKLKKDEFTKLAGADKTVEVTYSDANMDQQKQLDQIDNFITQGVSMIIVVPIDYNGVTPGIQAANKAGIPVICLGIEASGGDYTYVGCENRDAGVMQADYMATALPKNAKVLYLSGTPGLYHSVQRHDGFVETLKEKRSDVTVLAEMTGEYYRDKAQKVVEDWCQKYDQFDAIVAANDQMALGAIEALKAANRLNGVLVAGIDATNDALQDIKSGEMAISIRQSAPALAENCMKTIKAVQSGQTVEKRVVVDFESVTKDNVDKFLTAS